MTEATNDDGNTTAAATTTEAMNEDGNTTAAAIPTEAMITEDDNEDDDDDGDTAATMTEEMPAPISIDQPESAATEVEEAREQLLLNAANTLKWQGNIGLFIRRNSSTLLLPIKCLGMNPYKMVEMWKNYYPMVPLEYQDDELYAKPDAKVMANVKDEKVYRAESRAVSQDAKL